ncbi:MAG: choice-of-anchor Q domain-containing protein, partial [Bacteroidales bacterium]
LDSISHASVAWGDYDADGDLDLLMTGWLGSNSEYITKIYQNNDGVLEDTEMNLQGVMAGSDKSCGWTDFNNDGLLDFIITGAKDGQPAEYYTMLYKQVEGTFVETDLGMHALTSGSVDWGDYDHDGDYDLLINGKGSGSEYAGIYINKTNVSGAFEYNNYGFETVWSSAANWGDFDGDGDLDVLSSGLGATKSQYKNDLPGFSNVQSVLNSIQGRTADVGDFDMDGDLDIVMAGDNADTAYSCIFECVTHVGPATWAYSLKSNIQNIKSGSVAWGDYDNDGDPDLVVSGTKTGLEAHTVLYENHESAFWPDDQDFPDLGRSAAAWADYDNDGDLDLLLTGWGEDGPVSAIFRNNRDQGNTPPEAPEALAVEAGMDSVRLIWHTGSDNETAKAGLSYNLRMGTTPGGSEIISSLSLPDGYRQVPKMGNAGLDTSYIVYGLQPNTTYYWSVQAVDNCFEGSSFAQERSFNTSAEPQPEVIYVDMDALGNNDGTSWADAFNDLQDALHIADFGDSIWVAEGAYYPSEILDLDNINAPDPREATFLIPSGVKVYGGFEGTESRLYERDPKANETLLSGDIGVQGDASDNTYHVVCFINTGKETILDGFTITYGNSAEHTDEGEWINECGAGIFNECTEAGHFSNPAIVNCMIENNSAHNGGGMYNVAYSGGESSPVLTNCIIRGNVSDHIAGGIYFRSLRDGICEPILTNCLISGNRSQIYGGGLHFLGNESEVRQPILKNCTFSGNYTAMFGGGLAASHMDPILVNCILWNNRAREKGDEGYFNFSSPVIIYCNIKDGLDGIETIASNITYQNNLESDPLLVSVVDPEEAPTTSGDLHLLIGSPCIDAGLNDSVTVDIDLDGNNRIQNGTVDMGAYERPVSQGIIYVDQNASGYNDGTSWEDAFNNLQDALHIADFGDSIWVAASYYYPDRGSHVDRDDRNASFVIPDGVKLYGGFDGTEIVLKERDWKNNETFLTGNIGKEKDHSDNARHVVRFINTGDQTLLDGFIIIHGNSEKEDGGAGTEWPDQNPDLFGAGIFIETTEWNSVSNPKIHHCIIKNNKAYMGAGLCIWSCYLSVNKPELLNCKIQGNKAYDGGGGLYIASEGTSCPVLVNCLISGNEAEYSGGGIDFFTSTNNAQTEENTILKNCTFSGNSAEWGGAVRMTNMGPVFVNSILWNNLAGNSGNEVHLHDATPTFTHCDIQGGAEAFGRGGSNSIVYHEILDEDPHFATAINPEDAPTLEGDFHIEEISPCINTGLNDSVTVAVDLDGEPRIKNDTVDIGAYETEKPEDVPDHISSAIQNELKVYPNPTNGLLKIELSENNRIDMLKVTTISGMELISRRVNENTFLLDLSSCPGGVYLIRAIGGGDAATLRVIKY